MCIYYVHIHTFIVMMMSRLMLRAFKKNIVLSPNILFWLWLCIHTEQIVVFVDTKKITHFDNNLCSISLMMSNILIIIILSVIRIDEIFTNVLTRIYRVYIIWWNLSNAKWKSWIMEISHNCWKIHTTIL